MAEDKSRAVAQLKPIWNFDSAGKKTGLWVQCPLCQPEGSCSNLLAIPDAQTEKKLEELNVDVPPGNSETGCPLVGGHLQNGRVTWR